MTNRYVSLIGNPAKGAVRSGYYDYSVGDHVLMPDSCTVVEMDKSPIETGLLNAEGHRLYRVPETVKLGFHKD